MSTEDLLRRLRTTIEAARAMPLSASVIVNRTDVLDLLSQLEGNLSGSPTASATPAEGVEDTKVVRAAHDRASKLLSEAEQESAELRTETDEYVDRQLASLEISLGKTLEAVTRGREQLRGRSLFASLAAADDDSQAVELDLGGDQLSR